MAGLRAGAQVGSWTLRRFLGRGGNADVWEADRDGHAAALKVLRTRKTDSEPFRRFRIETRVVEDWRPDGVVPIIESFLPESLQPQEHAWIAMPVARPIREALGVTPTLEAVCEAVVEVARSLAAMGVLAHRDIKPSNLYFLDGRFLIGDFGLVSYPGKEDLTAASQELGPRNYLAPEMIANPAGTDGRQADVYSMAKTLWALAASRDAPPPGQLRRDEPLTRLGSFVQHPRIYQVEELLEEATAVDPQARPAMAVFAKRLQYFLEGTPAGPSDVRDAAAKVRSAVAGLEGAIREGTDPANKVVLYELKSALAPIASALDAAGLTTYRLVDNDDILNFAGRTDDLEAEGLDQGWSGGRAIETTVKVFDNFPAFRMLSGIAIEVSRDEAEAVMVAAHARNLGTEAEQKSREIRGRHFWVGTLRFDIHNRDSIARALEELSGELLQNLRPSLEAFSTDIEQWRFNPETVRKFGY